MACSTLVGRDPKTLTQEEITALVQVCCAAHDLDAMDKMQHVFEDLKDYFTKGYKQPLGTNCISFLPKDPSGYINCVNNRGK